MVSCAVVDDNKAVIELANGTVIDADQKKLLDGMGQEYQSLVSQKKLASRGLDVNEAITELPELTAARELLVKKFGQDGLKYIVTECIGTKTVGNVVSPNSVLSREMVTVPVGPGFVMYCSLWTTYWPWGCYNYAITGCSDPNTLKQTWLRDEVTVTVKSAETVADAYVFGSLKNGFYPPRPRGAVSTHFVRGPNIENGYTGWENFWN